MITFILVILTIYLVLGIALDILLHARARVIYWNVYEAWLGHLMTALLWPLALHYFLIDRE
jgi:hypothetical protein